MTLQQKCRTTLVRFIEALVKRDTPLPMTIELHTNGIGHVYVPALDATVAVTDRGWLQVWRGDLPSSELDTRNVTEAADYVAALYARGQS